MESNTVIIYKSKTGFTKRYAQWLAQALHCNAIPYNKRNEADLKSATTVIYGGYIHAGQIGGVKWLKEQLPALKHARVAVYATGGMPTGLDEAQQILEKNFTPDEWKQVSAFYFPGGINYEQMGAFDKFLMAMFRSMLKKSEGVEGETYRHLLHSYDITDQSALQPLIEWAKGEQA